MGIPSKVRVTEHGRDRVLWRKIAQYQKPIVRERRCKWVVGQMRSGLKIARSDAATSAKHKKYRDGMRAQAIAALGSKCVSCGYSHNILALDIDHIVEVERGINGKRKGHETGAGLHRRIAGGDTSGFQILCCNCHAIKTRGNGAIHRAVHIPTKGKRRAGLPFSPPLLALMPGLSAACTGEAEEAGP